MKNQVLAGRVALVTGAARNIGRAIARRLAQQGASVVLAARADEAGLREGVEQIIDSGGQAAFVLADLTDEAAVARMVDKANSSFGQLDVLVNNAAVRVEKPFEDITYADWRAVTSVILDGAFLSVRAALPLLSRSEAGAIINIGGLSAYIGISHRAHVIAAKAALGGLTRALAHELAPRQITVNLISPGYINTVRGSSAIGTPTAGNALPLLGRRGEPDEIAAMVCMLAGPDARYTTGQTIHLNGGAYMT